MSVNWKYAAAFGAGFVLAVLWTGIYDVKTDRGVTVVLNKLTGQVTSCNASNGYRPCR
jgi:hypothetical protein